MTEQDVIDCAGWMLLAWATGYTTGFLFKAVKQMLENAISGGG